MTTFSERLRYLRARKGLTQREIADKLGISESAYGYYEQGRREPPQDAYGILSDIFDVSLDFLILGKNPSNEKHLDDSEIVQELSKDPEAMLMFSDYASASEEDKRMLLEIWRSIKKNRKGEQEDGQENEKGK